MHTFGACVCQAPDLSNVAEFKKGFIMRKCCVDPDGRKSKRIVLLDIVGCGIIRIIGITWLMCLLRRCITCQVLVVLAVFESLGEYTVLWQIW